MTSNSRPITVRQEATVCEKLLKTVVFFIHSFIEFRHKGPYEHTHTHPVTHSDKLRKTQFTTLFEQ